MTMLRNDEELLDLLDRCDRLVVLQNGIKEQMRGAFFGMTLSRNNGAKVSIDYLRADLEASATLGVVGATGGHENTAIVPSAALFELFERKPDADPLLMMCGMPPPGLRKSQKHFISILKDAVEAANIVQSIMTQSGAEDNTARLLLATPLGAKKRKPKNGRGSGHKKAEAVEGASPAAGSDGEEPEEEDSDIDEEFERELRQIRIEKEAEAAAGPANS
jgi:hypothetical protein